MLGRGRAGRGRKEEIGGDDESEVKCDEVGCSEVCGMLCSMCRHSVS